MPMDAARWKEVEALYYAALDSPDPIEFLKGATAGDDEMRRELESLLVQETAGTSLPEQIDWATVADLMGPSAPPIIPSGTRLGPYDIVERLGGGGAGDVYKAIDPRLNRFVALKVLTETPLAGERGARFVREARAAASLNHPNIATIYEVSELADTCYISMEYIDGETLRQKLSDTASTLAERIEYLVQAAHGLIRAHEKGIVHCDLKPENLMVTRDGLVKILDFGLARLIEGYRRESAGLAPGLEEAGPRIGRRIEGTIGYMSPEQAAGGTDLDVRSDIFSFGCMLFEAAARRLPFKGESVLQSLDQVKHAPTPRISNFEKHVPGELQAIVDRCLEKDPACRWSSVEELSRPLTALASRLDRQGERRRRATGVGVLLLAAAVSVGGAAYWRWTAAAGPPSLAVIPFVSSQSTSDSEFLAEGISEGLINTLAQLPGVKVIARSSSFRFSLNTLDPREVARTLGVQMLVTGRAVDIGGHLRVTAELIDGKDGTAIWGADYTPNLDNLADVQAQIATEIARRVRIQLTGEDQAKLTKWARANPEAYALLLRGRYQMRLYNPASTQKAAALFEQALSIDPDFALANAELANTYRRLGGAGILVPAESIPLAEKAVLKALAADPELAEAHAVLADIRKDQWKWAEAESGYRRAIALSPSLAVAREGLAICLSVLARHDEAVAELLRARELDPIGLSSSIDAAAVFYNVRRFDAALEVLTRAAVLDGSAPALWTWTGIVNGGRGRFDEAVSAFEKAIGLGDSTPATLSYYVFALARTGKRTEALKLLERFGSEFVPRSALAIAFTGLADYDRALDLLEAAFADRDPLLQYIVVESHFDPIRSHQRFQQLVAKMELPQ